MRIEVWTANFGRGVGAERYKRDLRRLLEEVNADIAVLGLQEIDEADAPDEGGILRRLTVAGYAIAGREELVPILASRSRYRLHHRRVTFASKGLAKVTPHRVVVEVRADLLVLHGARTGRIHPEAPEFVFLNFHIPRLTPRTVSRRLRVRAVAAARAAWHVQRGRIVVATTDSNTRGAWKPLVRGEKVALDAGIDMILVYLPRRWGMRVIKRKKVDLRIDRHDAHGAVLDFFER